MGVLADVLVRVGVIGGGTGLAAWLIGRRQQRADDDLERQFLDAVPAAGPAAAPHSVLAGPATFPTVWYRSAPPQLADLEVVAWEDRGTLRVEPGLVHFAGRRGTVELRGLRRVVAARAGADIVNTWIVVEDEGGRRAMFVEGSLLGWRGRLVSQVSS